MGIKYKTDRGKGTCYGKDQDDDPAGGDGRRRDDPHSVEDDQGRADPPFVDLKTEYYDLGLPNRDATADQVTMDAALANKKYGVSVKCATITPNAQRVEEYKLHEMWKSPNGTIRAVLDGTVFRAPIMIDSIQPVVKNWKKPSPSPATPTAMCISALSSAFPVRARRNWCSPAQTAASSVPPSLTLRVPVCCRAVQQGRFHPQLCPQLLQLRTGREAGSVVRRKGYHLQEVRPHLQGYLPGNLRCRVQGKFEAAGITYFYSLIDDIVARVIRSEGGFVWACKNYDGDVMSDMVSTAFGSLAMMTSVLVSPDGKYEYEAAHGTVTRHYYKYLKGEKTSTNPMATIFAWSGAFKKRGELDNLPELVHFGEALEAASLQTLNEGIMTKDLCGLAEGITPTAVDSEGFIKAIRERLEAKLA